jgi:hypothetical protein
MAVVVVNEIEGGSQELYEKVLPKTMPEGTLPDGCQVHVAGPIDAGWRVITVWDSEDQFQSFRESTLIPALQEVGEGERVAPNIATNEAFKVIKS